MKVTLTRKDCSVTLEREDKMATNEKLAKLCEAAYAQLEQLEAETPKKGKEEK